MSVSRSMPDHSARRPPHVVLERTPYFVSTRTTDSRRIFEGAVAAAAQQQLLSDRERYGFRLLAYVFMPDHAHFVIVPADGRTISATMRVIKGGIAHRINEITGSKGACWQEGFFDKVAATLDQLNAYIQYIHNNPVKASLTPRAEDYLYSSASGDCMANYQEFLNVPCV